MTRRLALVLALLAPLVARADYPADYVPPEGINQFNVCRAAVFYHLDPKTRGASTLPIAVVRTLGEQIEFAMQEGVASEVPGSLSAGKSRTRFVESWFISFSQTLAKTRDTMVDPVQRDRIILDCIPFVWVGMQGDIEQLMRWRDRAINAPPRPTPEESLEGYQKRAQALAKE